MYSHTEGYQKAIDIYSFSPSSIPGPRVICTLQLPNEHLEPGEYIGLKAIHTGDRPQTSSGHFLPDFSRSMVILTFSIHGGPRGERETHYLIPRATLLAQVHAAESKSQRQQTHVGTAVPVPVSVPWADWGPQGCLRLALQPPVSGHCAMPFGSRFPLFVLDESDARNAAVYVFDVDPLVVRHQRQIAAARRRESSTPASLQEPVGESTGTATNTSTAGTVVEDVEAVLPGVVDPECSGIPYVVHRFQLSCADKEWRFVEAVAMGMTGFTIRVSATNIRCGHSGFRMERRLNSFYFCRCSGSTYRRNRHGLCRFKVMSKMEVDTVAHVRNSRGRCIGSVTVDVLIPERCCHIRVSSMLSPNDLYCRRRKKIIRVIQA